MSKFWKKINSPQYMIALGIALVLLGYLFVRQYKTKSTIDKEVSDLQKQADNLQKNNDQLQGFISYFQTDSYKEQAAREQLDVKKPGETVYSFAGDQDGSVLGASTAADSSDGDSSDGSESGAQIAGSGNGATSNSNVGKWWKYFFAKN